MCRYSWHNYRDHFACFDCRKTFKQWQWEPCDENEFKRRQRLRHVPREIVCPDCSKPMTDMGLDFRAPRKGDVEAWRILELLAQSGFTFRGCGCSVAFTPPRTLREMPAWLEEHRRKSTGEGLAAEFKERSRAKRENRKLQTAPNITQVT